MIQRVVSTVLIIIGIIAASFIYSMRPISGFGDMMARAAQSPNAPILHPVLYYPAMGIALLILLAGAFFLYRSFRR